jgi:hypothetical protein
MASLQRNLRRPVGSSAHRIVAACGLSAVSAVIGAGCSESRPIVLNTEKIERAIERSSMAQRGKDADVSCPSGVVQEKGSVFSCSAVVGHQTARFTVKQLDGAGHVRYVGR